MCFFLFFLIKKTPLQNQDTVVDIFFIPTELRFIVDKFLITTKSQFCCENKNYLQWNHDSVLLRGAAKYNNEITIHLLCLGWQTIYNEIVISLYMNTMQSWFWCEWGEMKTGV